ncbi:hypothetical protein JCM6882_006979 [Rhodosporidiobolus microsporus]
MSFNVETLRPFITQTLASADQSSVSAKAVRKAIQAQYPALDVKAHKEVIDALTTEIFTAKHAPEESSEDEKPLIAAAPKKASKPKLPTAHKKSSASASNSFPASSPAFPLAAAPKRSDSDDDNSDDDAAYARRLQAAYDAPERETRNGGLGGTMPRRKKRAKRDYSDDEVVDSDSTVEDAADGAYKAPKKIKTKRKKEAGEDGKPKKARTAEELKSNNKGFNKLYYLSPEMQAATGYKVLSRAGCTKHIWRRAKRKGLQNPSNKNEIIADDEIRAVLGGLDKIHSFTLAKHISKHLQPYDEEVHGDLVRGYSDTE